MLINKLSASASEIFAGVIKDYGRGLIIGDTSTFGKGTVQSIVQIGDHTRRRDRKSHGALKLTIQQFYRANGDSTQINGVTPDVHLPSIRDFMDFGEGKMDNALKFEKVPELPHDNYNKLSPELVTLLNERSAQRRKADPKFQKLDERIKQFLDRKARHSIALNEAKFKAEYAPDEDDPEHADEVKLKNDKKKKKFIERRGLVDGFLQRRGRADHRRLPDAWLQGPGSQPDQSRCCQSLMNRQRPLRLVAAWLDNTCKRPKAGYLSGLLSFRSRQGMPGKTAAPQRLPGRGGPPVVAVTDFRKAIKSARS